MMTESKGNLTFSSLDKFGYVSAKAKSCAYCGSTIRRHPGLSVADEDDPPNHSHGAIGTEYDRTNEDEIVNLVIQLLDTMGIANNLPASMRIIEHIAECAGYERAHHLAATNVTELMLMAARASALADEFRQDL